MKIVRCDCDEHPKTHWEIQDDNNPDCPLVGPYETKAEAEEDARGLKRFYAATRVRRRD